MNGLPRSPGGVESKPACPGNACMKGFEMKNTQSRAAWYSPVVAALVVGSSTALAGPVPILNPSFEGPATAFVDPRVDSWNKTPAPVWFDPALTGGITWDQLSGVFANPPVGQPTRKTNIDGNQALYLFTLPSAGLTQVLAASYEVGMSYELTVGVSGGGGGMAEGTLFQLGLFYLDGATPVQIGGTMVSYSATAFPATTTFVDQTFSLGEVLPGDAWAGKQIGIQLVAANGTGAGYWDLDNVRLEANVVPEPGTWALLGLGCGLVGVASWRRTRRS